MILIGNPENITAAYGYAPDDESILSYYVRIVKMLKSKQPDAKIFVMTIPYSDLKTDERNKQYEEFSEALRKFSNKSKNVYTLDFRKYGPVHDKKFNDNFFLGHMTPTGYLLTAKMVMSYIDYIIRNNPNDFAQVGFIGTPYKYM